jgi:hypothetical protein
MSYENRRWLVGGCVQFSFVTLAALAVFFCSARQASAQLLVNSSNSAAGATTSAPDPAHYQNTITTVDRAIYVGYDPAAGKGYLDNTGELNANGANVGGEPYNMAGNWGVGVGIFDGSEGYLINSGAGVVTSAHEIRIGDAFPDSLQTATGEFYQQSTGAVTAGDYLTVGNFGGHGKFSQTGSGAVDVGYELWVGVYTNAAGPSIGNYTMSNNASTLHVGATLWLGDSGGQGTFSQQAGNVTLDQYLFNGSYGGTGTYTQQTGDMTIGFAGNDYSVTVPELYVGTYGGNGTYNLNGGNFTVHGWTNIGRDTGVGVINNAGTFKTVQDLRIGANYDVNQPGGSGTVNNLSGGHLEADYIRIADVFFGGLSSTGLLTVAPNSTVSTTGPIFVGNGTGGTGTVTQTGGTVDSGLWITMGEAIGSTGTYNLVNGSVSTGNVSRENLVLGFAGTGKFNQTAGAVDVDGALVVGWTGTSIGDYKMDDGTISVTGPIQLGIDPGSDGTFTMQKGTITCNDWVVTGTFGGTGHFFQHGGTINTVIFDVGQGTGSNGDYHMDTANGPSQITASGFFAVGDYGTGTFDMAGGTTSSGGWTYVGVVGTGTFNVGGTHTAGDNFSIGTELGAVGNVNMTTSDSAVINVTGNAPTYTGNLVVGDHGTGHLTVSKGTINLNASDTSQNSLNSASYSVAHNSPPNILTAAQDGNLTIAEEEGTGTVNLSGTGKINVSANVFVGGFNTHPTIPDPNNPGGTIPNPNYLKGGDGTLTITGGEVHVGIHSPTGGDLVMGAPFGTPKSTINLQGGLLDVAHSVSDGAGGFYGGHIASGGGGTLAFNFTGGTLKVREWNSNLGGGNLGNLVQNGAGSLLDVTGNNTTLNSSYNLGAGTATVGGGRTLTAQGVLNSAGAGVINVGTGGSGSPAGDYNSNGTVDAADYVVWRNSGGTPAAYTTWRNNFGATGGGGGSPGTLTVGAGAIAVDTLNLNNGVVTAGGGVSVATALNGNGTINGSIVMASAANVRPGLSPGKLTITNDLTLGASGVLTIELGGTTPVTGYDQLDVDGALSIGGTLQVTLANGFTPSAGNSFDILDFATRTGTFTTVNLPPGTWNQSALYTTGVLTLTAPGLGAAASVPEPALSALLVLALTPLYGARRKR